MIKTAAIIIFLLLLGRAALEPTQLSITELSLPGGPEISIAVYADLHLAKGRAPLAKLQRALIAAKPDLIFALGDFSERHLTEEQVAYLRTLSSVAPTYGVLGNNDVDPRLRGQLREAGITLLENRGIELQAERGNIYLYGAEDLRAGKPDLAGLADAAEGDFVILLSHSPEIVTELAGVSPDLILAGHTHGGQICLPGGQGIITHSKLGPKYDSGSFPWGEGTLFITRGVGASGIPLRLFCLPELVIIRLGGK